ncbi:helicase-related protein [Butyrivibrio sp. YAB3001]|uniref:helicase-related protein n=1 Tax=Butyrivibrio sp. YAB3001 TaxID=1520812 RepID=UPI0008F63E54|nr:helicase-related protein [Butyrivibrio sp. YAB3001]SFC90547.1 ATP-dependent RNA helicase SUPV3L1/SUV3 [Butyrivibrio sp. YAB3001]
MRKKGRYNPFKAKKENDKKQKFLAEKAFPKKEFTEYWKKHSDDVSSAVYDAFLDELTIRRVFMMLKGPYGRSQRQEVHKGNIGKFCEYLPKKFNVDMLREMVPNYARIIYGVILNCDNMPLVDFAMSVNENIGVPIVMDNLRENKRDKEIVEYIRTHLNEMVVYEQLSHNRNYIQAAERIKKVMEAKRLLYHNIQESTPDDYTTLFPLARQMKRHFVLHIGPTNSGKTYQAVQELMAADSGIYLAPLRLLAYEQYEFMNGNGCPCSMITGEERILMPGSFHQSSTIEMMSLKEEWDMAIIDEAQMVADRQRGGSWTAAILGLRAKKIHVCASPDAEKLITRMIKSCGDTVEIVHHERKTPLQMDEEASNFRFPEYVQKGDALIVFSRKDVHSVAAELQDSGLTCSIIYGSLPYDVRHREAGKFADGETDVVVATDAIGMGMNLPIRRVVFLETVKFDGIKERPLTVSEIKQIAGRAGRFGKYDVGYVTSYYDYDIIKYLVFYDAVPISRAMINIPEEFLEKDGKISTILELWNQIPAANYYDKGDIAEKITVARALEDIKDDRELIRQFIRIPINIKNEEIFGVYKQFYSAVAEERAVDLEGTMKRFDTSGISPKYKQALQILETSSAVYDFLYSFTRLFGDEEDLELILETKRTISEKIFTILDMQKLSMKSCKCCGKKLKWSYKYAVCQECYRKGRK